MLLGYASCVNFMSFLHLILKWEIHLMAWDGHNLGILTNEVNSFDAHENNNLQVSVRLAAV